jgi:hypothetical protein
MQHWSDLEAAEPAIAAAARRLLWIPGLGFGYLATVRADGGPRIHPVNLAIVDGRLVAFVGPSPKLRDLRRDGRFALHATGSADENDEVAITGVALERNDDDPFRAACSTAMPWDVADDNVLFELRLQTVLCGEYPTPPRFPPAYHRWRAGGSG